MQKLLLPLFLLLFLTIKAQTKKPLDHTVYDSWKSISERLISNDGQFVVYTVNPQEGDGELVIQNPSTKYRKVVPRGYSAVITEDSRFLIFKIKPFFQDTRQAKIKKKKADETPRDSLAIIELGQDSIFKKARIKSYKTPEKGSGFLAYQLEKPLPDTSKKKAQTDSAKIKNSQLAKIADSVIRKSIDSIKGKITREELIEIANKAASQIIKEGKDMADAEGDEATGSSASDGTDLVLRNLDDNRETIFKLVNEFYFDKKGTRLLIETSKNSKDSNSRALVLWYNLQSRKTDTVFRGFNDSKNYAIDEAGNQLAFVAERDSSEKALTKFYKLWYYTTGQDSAKLLADKNTVGMKLGHTISEHATLNFSKDGSKLFFGSSPVRAPKDTTLIDFELARLDVWNYKDDYLQPQQLKNMDAELKRSYPAVYHISQNKLVQLGAEDAESISVVNEGNADWVLAETNKGNRVEAQWTGRTKSTAFIINALTGERKPVFKNLYANAEASPGGKFVYWYNAELKNYFTYEVSTGITRNITASIKTPLYDEENDVPDYASPYGVIGWHEGDSIIYVYDKYGFWTVSPVKEPGIEKRFHFYEKKTKAAYTIESVYRYIKLDREERFIRTGQVLAFRVFNKQTDKTNTIAFHRNDRLFSRINTLDNETANPSNYNGLMKAKNETAFAYSRESFINCPDLYYSKLSFTDIDLNSTAEKNTRLSDINPQQKDYNWGTAELVKWKTYSGKETEGIIYKPEDFDPKKKYPLICYFYEKYSDNLHNYVAPAPTPSRLNISFFVSRGYIVLAPDISYTTGHPGNDAYNTVASGARALVKMGFVDSTKIGIQGQSWGGYQVAYLITRTKLFAAAWAGAPVANMTSAYGGIRWESGLNRQFQYEKSQSRIGAALWDKPQLYIENSPLFHLPKVQTPLVIMHNDADGAVPWYQGIELFTGLRRLGKPVWMLNYNGEAHNLIERKNRRDIQVREQQFFDWILKGEKPAKWLTEGVPATEKGKDWGLKLD